MYATSEVNLYRNYERQRNEATRKRPMLPVTLITGFLGSGKTTLLRNILRSKQNLRIAALVNDYGEVDHDGGVIERDKETDHVVKLAGGCVCCTMSLKSELESRIWRMLQDDQSGSGEPSEMYDYLVVETSGVTDPESVIQVLDRKFGKLTRVRLDSVVTVVDGDSLYHQLTSGERQLVATKKQLERADVVIVNKKDLLQPDQLAVVLEGVSSTNPLAVVHSCSFGNVPLHHVLDVEVAKVDLQGVSHERIKTHFYVSPTGGNLRKTNNNVSNALKKAEQAKGLHRGCPGFGHQGTGGVGHLAEDGLEEVTFTSKDTLYLSRFQDWVCMALPVGVVRVKGMLAFEEDKLTRAVFNMSGRRRMSFETDGQWEGPLQVYLVVIGVGLDRDMILRGLEGCKTPPEPETNTRGSLIEELKSISMVLRDDPLFDMGVVGEEEGDILPRNGVVRFRFTGSGVYGMTPMQLSTRYGVDLDVVNRTIMRVVNSGESTYIDTNNGLPDSSTPATVHSMSKTPASEEWEVKKIQKHASSVVPGLAGVVTSPRLFLSCEEGVLLRGERGGNGKVEGGGEEECLVLRYAAGGCVSLEAGWTNVVRLARRVMARDMAHVGLCNCRS